MTNQEISNINKGLSLSCVGNNYIIDGRLYVNLPHDSIVNI